MSRWDRLREIKDGPFYFSLLSFAMSMFGKENSNRKELEICEDPCMLLNFFENKKITLPKAPFAKKTISK